VANREQATRKEAQSQQVEAAGARSPLPRPLRLTQGRRRQSNAEGSAEPGRQQAGPAVRRTLGELGQHRPPLSTPVCTPSGFKLGRCRSATAGSRATQRSLQVGPPCSSSPALFSRFGSANNAGAICCRRKRLPRRLDRRSGRLPGRNARRSIMTMRG
jgi:hypothetical protein